MRKLELKEQKFTEDGQEHSFSYRQTLLAVLNQMPVNNMGHPIGLGLEEIENRLQLRKKIKEAEQFLYLEEAEYSKLKSLVLNEKWVLVHPVLVEMVKDVKEAPEHKL